MRFKDAILYEREQLITIRLARIEASFPHNKDCLNCAKIELLEKILRDCGVEL